MGTALAALAYSHDIPEMYYFEVDLSIQVEPLRAEAQLTGSVHR